MTIFAVIPARLASARFPGKPLIPIAGVPLVQRVLQRVRDSGVPDRVVLATADHEIARLGRTIDGVDVVLDNTPAACGSDRVANALALCSRTPVGADVVINVQVDELLVDASYLKMALAALEGNDIGTVSTPLSGPEACRDRDVVKVWLDDGRARRFSRDCKLGRSEINSEPMMHIGVYAFTPSSLRRFATLPRSENELRHELEQLRALDAGFTIGVRQIDSATIAINRPSDLNKLDRDEFDCDGRPSDGFGRRHARTEQM
jgi:3-deoxy-manno-octulosonate cytidylyltransferase (CMP-KDO synthetase)